MATRVSAGLTASEGRRFGFTVGAAFLLLGLAAFWRGHQWTGTVLASLGTGLVIAGLLVPTRLGPVESVWMRLAHAISRLTTPVVMGVMFMLVITPIGMLRRAVGGNPLVHQPRGDGFWIPRAGESRKSSSLNRQF